jgi:hypothetical protein
MEASKKQQENQLTSEISAHFVSYNKVNNPIFSVCGVKTTTGCHAKRNRNDSQE